MSIFRQWDDLYHKRSKAIVDHFGEKFFLGRKILDVGCGWANVAMSFARLGADILCVDVRPENIKMVNDRYPFLKTQILNLEEPLPLDPMSFDLVLSLDVLCHLKNYEKHLNDICNLAENIVLETEVLDNNDPNIKIVLLEEKSVNHLSFCGEGSIVSAKNIQNKLSNIGATFKRIDDKKLNSISYSYDWKEQESGRKFGNRRFYFIRRDRYLAAKIENTNHLRELIPIVDEPRVVNPPTTQTTVEFKKSYIAPPINTNLLQNKEQKIQGLKYSNIENPKIAVCISGHLRTFESNFNSFSDNILGIYKGKADVFVHTWETIGSRGSKGNADNAMEHLTTSSKMDVIRKVLNPKKIIIESYKIYGSLLTEMDKQALLTPKDKEGLHGKSLINYGSMLFSMNEARKLLETYENENNIKYDLIIRYRPDLFMLGAFNIQDYLADKLYLPNAGQYYIHGVNDQIAIGDNRSIKVYLSLFESILEYINMRACDPLRPEVFLRYHLFRNQVPIIETNMPYQIIRPNGGVIVNNAGNRGQTYKHGR